MPASDANDAPNAGTEPVDPGDLPAREVSRLEDTVDRVMETLRSLEERASEAEGSYEQLRRALDSTGSGSGDADDAGSAEARLRRLSEENERLREILDEGRERAERMRRRLILLEDEK